MAVTEITKILFRRGTASDRSQLEQFGGLAQGEPGFTVVGTETNAPTGFDIRSAYLRDEDVISYTQAQGGIPNTDGGGDLFIGGSEGKDIYIGGSSAEKHYQRYFVSLRGTGYNTNWSSDTQSTVFPDDGFIDGKFVVGKSGGKTNLEGTDDWNVVFYGNRTSDEYNLLFPDPSTNKSSTRGFWWRPNEEALELWSNTSLKLPAGTSEQRPGSGDFVPYTPTPGMVRFNTTSGGGDNPEEDYLGFEGYDGDEWVSLHGSQHRGSQTYVTVEHNKPDWAVKHSNQPNLSDIQGSTGFIKFVTGQLDGGTERKGRLAGYFDNSRNLHVINDVIAFSSSDERLKHNIQLIDNPTQKIAKLDGVTFTWSEDGPAWVEDLDTREDVGLLAQQVEQVVPEAVVTRDDGYKAIDYKRVIPLLVESIKELTTRVEHLESQSK